MNTEKSSQLVSRYEIIFDIKRGFAELSFHGSVDLELINTAFLGLMNHPSFRHNMNACYDYDKAIIETDMRDVEQHAQFVSQYLNERGSQYRLALVSNETLNSALLNVYRLLISKTEVEAEVFGSKKQALQWLTNTEIKIPPEK